MNRPFSFFLPATCFLLLATCLLPPVSISAADEIQIENVLIDAKSPLRHYELSAAAANSSEAPRDVILRGQIAFYDKAAPQGDVPVMILRKDMNVVLRAKESRTVRFDLLNEGAVPVGSLRLEPSVRIRRNREWNY